MNRVELVRLARLGAHSRLAELQRESEAIYRSFPELRPGRASRSAMSTVVRGTVAGVKPIGRRKMSREARKRIAEAQKKRWAEWKARTANPAAVRESAAAPDSRGRSRKKK